MRNVLESIFGVRENIIIGAIHFPPLPGYPGWPGFDRAKENALADLHALETGGAQGIIFENNYDIPHRATVDPQVAEALATLGAELKARTALPMGVSVLWNDYRTALAVAQKLGLSFVRVPVFVDTVKTAYGVMMGDAAAVAGYRREIGAQHVALFTDIHVKHAQLLSPHDLAASARLAVEREADALIVTGKWTGDAPNVDDLKTVREAVGDFPLLAGSGVDEQNVQTIFTYANGAIVSTSLKEGAAREGETNVKGWDQRINRAKVETLVRAAIGR